MRRPYRISFNQLLQIPSNFHLRLPKIELLHLQVCFPFSQPLSFSMKNDLFTSKTPSLKPRRSYPNYRILFHIRNKYFTTNQTRLCSVEKPTSSSGDGIHRTHLDLTLNGHSGIGRSVILKCSHLWEKKGETFAEPSLKDLLLKLSDLSPQSTRRFQRVSRLKREDVLELLLGFALDCGECAMEAKNVDVLWKLFKLAANQSKDFEHLPKSYEIMASMLIRVGSLREAQALVQTSEALLANHEILSRMIEGYATSGELDYSISLYNEMRRRSLIPSLSCYQVLLNLLLRMNKTRLAFRVYMDMVELRFTLSSAEKRTFELLVRLLCKHRKIQEARNLVKKVIAFGLKPSLVVINEIAKGYCEKRDFEDLLSFLGERECVPDVPICNKIVYSLCRNFGTEKAYMFLQDLEYLGFRPDEITFGILVGWSCREGKLKDAFVYLSELLSRSLKPDLHSYNAIISGLFKEGMWKHARDILDEMLDKGITPNLLTFRVLLAGYCKCRLFDEAKVIVGEMMNHGWIQLSPSEDPLSKAFMVLGLNPLSVKVKRDNDMGLSKAEFFDALGNGLYLETDIDEYEKTVMEVLENSLIPDFNSLVMEECRQGNVETALMVKDEMVWWGQELSLSAYSALVNGLCATQSHVKAVFNLLEEMPEKASQLDQITLNLLIQAISQKRFTYQGRIILNGMLRRSLLIKNETYTALILGFCKEGNQRELHECWELARKHKWLPSLKDCKALVGHLCQLRQLREALELFGSMLGTTHSIVDICNVFLEELCVKGFTSIGHVLVEEVLRLGWSLDQAAYNHLIRGFCNEKRFGEAFGMLDAMLEKNMTVYGDVFSMLIPQLCRSHKMEEVMTLKERMLRELPRVSLPVYNSLVNGFCKLGKVREATFHLQEMLAKGALPDTETYNAMVQGHCKVNNLRRVEELLSIMIRKNFFFSISSYRNLVCLMCMEGRVLHALSMKELMLEEANSPMLVVYNILIHHLFQSGNSLLVATLLDEMHKKGLVFDEVSYNFLVHGYSKSKNVSRSVEALKTMIGKDLRPNNRSMGTVIRHLCCEGELDKALELSRVMELRGWVHGSVVQNAIVEGLLSHGRLQEAEDFLDRMKDKDLVPNSICYDILIKRFCWYGRLNKAVDLMNIMLKKGNLPSPTSYNSVIQCLCVHKSLDEALDFHSEMLNRNLEPSINSWDVLVCGLCEGGRTAEAEMLLDSMLQLGQTPTWKMYHSVINRYRLENHLSKASELLHKMQQNGYVPDFETHWSFISNVRNSNDKDGSESGGFLSKLLSQSGFTWKKDSKTKSG